MLVKVHGPPEAVADRAARGLAARGYDEQTVRDALVHDVDGVSLPAAGEQLDVLLGFLDGMDARYIAWPLLPDGGAGRAAAEKRASWAPLWGIVSVVCFALAAVVVLLPEPGEGVPRGLPDLGVAVAVVDAAAPAPDTGALQVIGVATGIARATMERARAVSVRIETADGRMGAGVVVSAEGDVLTTAELLRNDRRATVRFADGRFEQAIRGAVPPREGYALLRLDSKVPTVAATLGRGLGRTPGEAVFVVGSLGADFAIRAGKLTRPLVWSEFRPYLTCDAGLGPFHEGAPLFDRDGRVLGITTGGMHRRERLVAYIESAVEGDTTMTDAGLGRPLSQAFVEVMASASRGEVDPDEAATKRPELTGVATRHFVATRRRSCPRSRSRGASLCRADVKVVLLQVLPSGGERLDAGDAHLRFEGLGGADAVHARGRVEEWLPIDPLRAKARLMQMRRKRYLPTGEGRILEGTAVFSGLDLYRHLMSHPKTGNSFVVEVDGVESNAMTIKLR